MISMKLSIKKYILSCFLLLAGAPLCAQQTLSLDSVLQLIRDNNPALEPFRRRAEAMEAYTTGAREWMAPMAGVGTFMTPYPGQEVMNPDNRGALMFSIEQQIPHPARQNAREAWYGSRAAVEEDRLLASYNELRAAAKKAYYQWAVLAKKQAVLLEMERIMQTMKKLAEIRYPYAQGTLGTIYKAEGRLYEVQNMLLMLEGEIEQQNIRLNSLMNLPLGTDYRIDTAMLAKLEPTVLADTAGLAARRSDIRAMEGSIRSMELNRAFMATEGKPDFRLRFDHMSSYSGMMPQQFTLMGMVSIPIAPWASRGYKAQVQGMQYEIRAMEEEREAMLNEAAGMLAEMQIELRSLALQLQNYQEKIIPALRKNFKAVRLAYEENKEQLPMVIDAWESLNSAQLNYLDQLQKYYLTLAEYEQVFEK